jgi:uncharacterized protein (DUF433 family)
MDWRQYLHSDPKILLGKPAVKGTRLSVEFLLGLFAAGWTEPQVLEKYPTLTLETLRAVFAFPAECMREESLYTLPVLSEADRNRSQDYQRQPIEVIVLEVRSLSMEDFVK